VLPLKGSEGPSPDEYHVQLSAAELALLVENALLGASHNGAIHAQVKAMGAFIREVLDVKNKPS
jgi:hypothetical protein